MRAISSKKGQLSSLPSSIITLILAGIFLVFWMIILQEIRDTDIVDEAGAGLNNTVYLTANDTITGLGTFGDFWEIIVLAVVIAVVIGLLLVVFGGSRSR